MTILFVRHGKVTKDPSKPAPEWDLSPDAIEQLKPLLDDPLFKGVDYIYSSTESKSVKTAEPFAQLLDLPIHQLGEFCEVHRSSKYFTDEEFLEEKKRQLDDLDYTPEGGESGRDALVRFRTGLQKINAGDDETVLVVSHGTILSLFFTEQEQIDNRFAAWQRLRFCSYGVMTDGKITKTLFD